MHVGGADSPQVITLPPFVFIGALVAGFALDYLVPLPGFIPWPYGLVGLLCILAALVLGARATKAFRAKGTEVDPRKAASAIVSDGPFRYTRNPMYVGMTLTTIGVALMADSLWILIALVPALLIIRYGVIAREEAYLERKFGQEYLAYKSRVRRWL